MDTTVVTLIPALIAPLAAVVPAFPATGRVQMSAATAALVSRTVATARARPLG